MKTKMDERTKLIDAISKLDGKIIELNKRIVDAKAELASTIDTIIVTGEGDPNEFNSVKDNINLYEALLYELNSRQKGARLALWNYDLAKAKENYSSAVRNATEIRLEIIQLQADKVKLLRETSRSSMPEYRERLNHLDILLADSQSRSRIVNQTKNQKKIALETLKTAFNGIAIELGAVEEPLISDMARLAGR
jgi:hypothetical protein